jgi:hypothetical protein
VTSTGAPLGAVRLGVGLLGWAARDDVRSYYPEVRVDGSIVQQGWYNPDPNVPLPGTPTTFPGPAYISYVPEPAMGAIFLGLAVLLFRKRR